MERLRALTDSEADPRAREIFVVFEKNFGMVPNLIRTMAHSPAVLEGYLGLSGPLAQGSLSPKLREQIALVVAETNRCGYCLAVHAALSRRAGLTEEGIADSRRGSSRDRKTQAALDFARTIVHSRGQVSDEAFRQLRIEGFNDRDISEIVANVAVNIFTNYMYHVAGTEIDFPEVDTLDALPACGRSPMNAD